MVLQCSLIAYCSCACGLAHKYFHNDAHLWLEHVAAKSALPETGEGGLSKVMEEKEGGRSSVFVTPTPRLSLIHI